MTERLHFHFSLKKKKNPGYTVEPGLKWSKNGNGKISNSKDGGLG